MDLNFNGRVNEFYNGNEWDVNLEMKMGTLIGNEFEKRFDNLKQYGYWLKRLTENIKIEQTINI